MNSHFLLFTHELKGINVASQAALTEHLNRQSAESGAYGQPVFMPYENPPDYSEEVRQKAQLSGWTRKVGEVNWLISWGVWAEGKVIAHVNLAGSPFEAQQHRGTLSLGVERAHQGYGLATELLTTAVERARNEALKWVDLRVFSHNERAISLYEKFGFKEVGRFADYFRLKGQQIDAVSMTRKLQDSMPLTPAEAQSMRRTA